VVLAQAAADGCGEDSQEIGIIAGPQKGIGFKKRSWH